MRRTVVAECGDHTVDAGNGEWDVRAAGQQNGANIDLTSDGSPVTFSYDHRRHFVTSTAQGPIVVAPGSFQSEMGCGLTGWPGAISVKRLQG